MSFLSKILVATGLKEETRTANAAKERLMVTVSHQRRYRHSPDYLPMLEKDILAVIAKYVEIEEDKVAIRFDRADKLSTLEVNIELPPETSIRAKTKKIIDPSEDIITPAKGFGDLKSGGYKFENKSESRRVKSSVFVDED